MSCRFGKGGRKKMAENDVEVLEFLVGLVAFGRPRFGLYGQ